MAQLRQGASGGAVFQFKRLSRKSLILIVLFVILSFAWLLMLGEESSALQLFDDRSISSFYGEAIDDTNFEQTNEQNEQSSSSLNSPSRSMHAKSASASKKLDPSVVSQILNMPDSALESDHDHSSTSSDSDADTWFIIEPPRIPKVPHQNSQQNRPPHQQHAHVHVKTESSPMVDNSDHSAARSAPASHANANNGNVANNRNNANNPNNAKNSKNANNWNLGNNRNNGNNPNKGNAAKSGNNGNVGNVGNGGSKATVHVMQQKDRRRGLFVPNDATSWSMMNSISSAFNSSSSPHVVVTFFDSRYVSMFELFLRWFNYSMSLQTSPGAPGLDKVVLLTTCLDTSQECQKTYNSLPILSTCRNCVYLPLESLLQVLGDHFDRRICYKRDRGKKDVLGGACEELGVWGLRVYFLKYLLDMYPYRSFLFTDSDALWLQNPYEWFATQVRDWTGQDVIGSKAPHPRKCGLFYPFYSNFHNFNFSEHVVHSGLKGLYDRVCFGFVYFKNTRANARLVQHMIEGLDIYEQDDQIAINCVASNWTYLKYNTWGVDDKFAKGIYTRTAPVGEVLKGSVVNNIYVGKEFIEEPNDKLNIVLLPLDDFNRFCQWHPLKKGKTVLAHCNIGKFESNKVDAWKKMGFGMLLEVPTIPR